MLQAKYFRTCPSGNDVHLNILLVPDKFKGTLTAQQVCDALRTGLLAAEPSLHIKAIPLADGGEGTCNLLTEYSGGSFVRGVVHDPLMRAMDGVFGLSPDGDTAFLEMASVSGLQLLAAGERNPLHTTTYGTGQLIAMALDRGVKNIFMGVGGSATNDGGMGMAAALGVVFRSAEGDVLAGKGENLSRVYSIDATALHPRLRNVSFTIFCDVDNPLHGPQGAAHVFAPQKGADAATVALLDRGLQHFESVLVRAFNRTVNFPGAGAGGGLPASLRALTHIDVRRGMDFMIEFTRLEQYITRADLIVTGEGKIDTQTLSGKVVHGVGALARKHQKPVWAVCGRCELTQAQLHEAGISQVISLAQCASEHEAIHAGFSLLQRCIGQRWVAQRKQ